jgi:hypothetical protein
MEGGSYRLVMQYPRRIVEPGMGGTLGDVGMVPGQQETLMLEAIAGEDGSK